MGRTPDRFPGTREEEELLFDTNAPDPTDDGAARYNGTSFRMKDAAGVFDPRNDSTTHRAEDQLVHDIAENSYTEVEYTGNRADAIRTYTNVGKTEKIREQEITYTGSNPTTIITKQYAAGVLVETYTEVFTYSGPKVTSYSGALT